MVHRQKFPKSGQQKIYQPNFFFLQVEQLTDEQKNGA